MLSVSVCLIQIIHTRSGGTKELGEVGALVLSGLKVVAKPLQKIMKTAMGSRTEGARGLKALNFENLGNKRNRTDS